MSLLYFSQASFFFFPNCCWNRRAALAQQSSRKDFDFCNGCKSRLAVLNKQIFVPSQLNWSTIIGSWAEVVWVRPAGIADSLLSGIGPPLPQPQFFFPRSTLWTIRTMLKMAGSTNQWSFLPHVVIQLQSGAKEHTVWSIVNLIL